MCSVPQRAVVPSGFEGRELALTEDTAHSYEPSGRDIMHALGQIANNILINEDLHTETTKVLLPVCANLDASIQILIER